jgi:hypothetical protein
LAEGEHLSLVICTRARGMGGPVLVPFVKWAITHAQGVHSLGRCELGVDWNEVCFKGITEFFPSAEIGWSGGQGSILPVLGPFAGGRSKFKVSEGGGNSFVDGGVQVGIEVVVVG